MYRYLVRTDWSGLCLGNVLQPVTATAKLEHTTIEALIKKPLAS